MNKSIWIGLSLLCLGGVSHSQDVAFPPESLESLLNVAYPENLIEGHPDYLTAVPPTSEEIAQHQVGLAQINRETIQESIRWIENIVKPEFLSPEIASIKQRLSTGDPLSAYSTFVALNNHRGLEAKDLRHAIGRSVTLPTGEVIAYPGLNPEWKGDDIFLSKNSTQEATVYLQEKGRALEITIVFRNAPTKTGVDLIRDTLQRCTRIPADAMSRLDTSEIVPVQNLSSGAIYCGITANDPTRPEWVLNRKNWWDLIYAITDGRFVHFFIEEVDQSGKRGSSSDARF